MSADSAVPSWEVVLDSIELDVAAAMSGDAPLAWEPPTGLGPLPPELHERARLVLEAQGEAAILISMANVETTRHLHAIASIPEPGERAHLGFLDVTG